MRRVKPGYIILGVIALFVAYKHFFDDSEVREYYTKEVNSFLTDLKHEDSFALQSKLAPNLKQVISIDELQNFINSVKLGSRYKFELKDYDKEDNSIKIIGNLIKKDTKEQLRVTLKDINGTLYIESSEIGSVKLTHKNLSFPLVSSKKR